MELLPSRFGVPDARVRVGKARVAPWVSVTWAGRALVMRRLPEPVMVMRDEAVMVGAVRDAPPLMVRGAEASVSVVA